MKQKEKQTLFGKRNYILMLTGSVLLIAGYVLMSGKGSTLAAYNPDIFSSLRICIAPVICLSGYLLIAFGICYRSNSSGHLISDNP